jgi:hypothetical protein
MSAGWAEQVSELVRGRAIIMVGGPLAALTPRVEMARRLGADAILAIGHGRGTGDVPDPRDAVSVVVEPGVKTDIGAEFTADEAMISSPPEVVREAIENFDPEGRAVVFALPMLGALPDAMYGRPIVGHRSAAWCVLEDKLVVGELWQDAGVAQAPFEIVAADASALRHAAQRLDRGDGTVWAADATRGWHGGAEGTRWVRNAPDAEEAFAILLARAEQVRVMPFIEGIPCSAMGMVFPSGVAALRPVENVVLRAPEAPVFRYGGVTSWWDPPAADREAMMAAVRRVGRVLVDRWSYRGAFTVDGILGADGFVPTELNPRTGASAIQFQRAAPNVPLEMLNRILIAGLPCDVHPEAFEAEIGPVLDAHRVGGSWIEATVAGRSTEHHELRWGQRGFRRAMHGATPDASLVTGPGVGRGRIEFRPSSSLVPSGASVAPFAIEAFRWADEVLGTQIGPLTAAITTR